MAKYAYRCSRCRARNMFRRRVEHYKIERKCKACGYTRFYWDKARNERAFMVREDICRCLSPYPWPHRAGSKFCKHNSLSEYHLRIAAGEKPSEIEMDMRFAGRWPMEVAEEPIF